MPRRSNNRDAFTRFTSAVSSVLGHAWVFVAALVILVIWACSGPLLGFSNTWQLIINTGTTIVTFLMVFIIQNTQNRDNLAMNIKLDAMMDKLGIDEDDLYEAEDASDKKLEQKKAKMQRKSGNGSTTTTKTTRKTAVTSKSARRRRS